MGNLLWEVDVPANLPRPLLHEPLSLRAGCQPLCEDLAATPNFQISFQLERPASSCSGTVMGLYHPHFGDGRRPAMEIIISDGWLQATFVHEEPTSEYSHEEPTSEYTSTSARLPVGTAQVAVVFSGGFL